MGYPNGGPPGICHFLALARALFGSKAHCHITTGQTSEASANAQTARTPPTRNHRAHTAPTSAMPLLMPTPLNIGPSTAAAMPPTPSHTTHPLPVQNIRRSIAAAMPPPRTPNMFSMPTHLGWGGQAHNKLEKSVVPVLC